MQLNLNLPAEVEAALRRKAATFGQDLESFLTTVFTEEVADELKLERKQHASRGKFAKRLDAWTKLHPVLDHPIDDSRESFYEGRE